MINRQQGDQFEAKAAKLLTQQGYKILSTNYQCKLGEIDIIAKHKSTVIFVEVKYRKNDNFGSAASHVTPAKQRRIRLTAELYLKENRINSACRFDVIGYTGTHPPEWIQNAF